MDISYTGVFGPRLRKEMPDGIEQMRVLPRRSWKLIGVAAGLVLLKDASGLEHAFEHRGSYDKFMAVLWISIVVMFLVAIIGEFFGSEVFSIQRGELVVRRGIGPLRRTFRYPVSGIRELVSSDPTDKYGKRHLGNIFMKPKAGAVRFECGGKTCYFADWLDEAGGETIVQWLKPRLPASATEPLPPEYGGAANFRP
jgi:hypothetical protein